VPRERLPELVQGLKVPFHRFDVILDHAEVWPNNVAVLQPRAVPDVLRDLHERLGLAVLRLGLPLDGRPFQPHVTLARHARGAVLAGRCEPVRWRAGAYVLAESKGGYQVLTQFG
ncbi:MAG: 2'-5' RNA ligase family protein, partial [Pseudomonadota bacterium]